MNRRFLNSLCSVLVLASYLWSGCVACKEIGYAKAKPADCCQHDQCKRSSHSLPDSAPQPDEASCDQPDQAVASVPESRSQLANFALAIDEVAPSSADAMIAAQSAHPIQLAESPPAASRPDLTILHVSFLI